MYTRNIRTHIGRNIDKYMNNRKQEKEKVLVACSKKCKNSKKSDHNPRDDIFSIFSILFYPERWYTEEIPYRKSDQCSWHKVFLSWDNLFSMLCHLVDIECMVVLSFFSTECDTKKLSYAHDTRKDMCLEFFVGWDFCEESR